MNAMLRICRKKYWIRTLCTKTAVPSVEVSPKSALVDEKIRLRVVNLKPSQEVTLQAWVSERGAMYTSCGQFVADGHGCVDTTQHSSLGGTYTGIDGMGLFWSLKLGSFKPMRLLKSDVTTPLAFDVRVLDGHVGFDNLPHTSESVLASTTCERWYKHHSVRRIVVREGKLRGTLFLPAGPGPHPGVVDMFGIGGGLVEIRGALLASRGFASLALAYSDFEDLPRTQDDIDIRYVLDAVDLLSGHPSVQPGGVGMVGFCKGGLLSLACASLSNKVSAVVSINGPAFNLRDGLLKDGETLLEPNRFDFSAAKSTEDGKVLLNCFSVKKLQVLEAWKNNAKILYLCGDDDGIIDHKTMSTLFYWMLPLEYKKNVEIIHYPGAGHLIEPPYMPLCRTSYHENLGVNLCWGGYLKPHAVAQEDAWRRLLKFLQDNLDQRPGRIS